MQYHGISRTKPKKTALAEHHFSLRSITFNFGDVKVLDRELNYRKRLLSEMINIKINEHSPNKKNWCR